MRIKLPFLNNETRRSRNTSSVKRSYTYKESPGLSRIWNTSSCDSGLPLCSLSNAECGVRVNSRSNSTMSRSQYEGLRSPIVTTSPQAGDSPMDGTSRTNCGVYVALILTCIGINLASNSVWIQIPVLERTLTEVWDRTSSEGKSLSTYLLILAEAGNVSCLLLILARKCISRGINEVPFLYICIALKITCMALTALYWSKTTYLMDEPYSLTLLACFFVLSQMASLGPLLYIPFGGRFKSQYITAVFLGEALSALLPHVLGIAEGVLLPSECQAEEEDANNSTKRTSSRVGGNSQYGPMRNRPSTTPVPLTPPELRFNESIYFYAVTGLLALGGVTFLILRYTPSIRFEYEETQIDTAEEEGNTQMLEDDDPWQANCDNIRILDDGSVRGSVHQDGYASTPAASVAKQNQHSQYGVDNSNRRYTPSPKRATPYLESPVNRFQNSPQIVHKRQSDPDRVTFSKSTINTHSTPTISRTRLSSRSSSRSRFTSAGSDFRETVSRQPSFSFTLLMTIVFWCSAVIHGPLSSVKAHSCLPVANHFFLIGSVLSNAAGIIACIVTHRFVGKLSITIIVALTSLGTILLTYFVALLAFSHASESSEQSLIFSQAGELLGTIAWVAIGGLFSFARVGIAVICRELQGDWLLHFSAAAQLGCALGSLCIADYFSICMVYRSFQQTTCNHGP